MKQAILAAEDERFYQHGGVDYLSVARAALANLATGTQQGAGTITMQVARNFFLTREKTVTRKLREVLLAWKIEANLSKDEILELYVNQIFLGQRAYGFAAASQIYFGRPLKDVTVAEAAMLAGLPKAPSAYNPVTNPKRAKARQLYVLRRMHELRFISDAQLKDAQDAPAGGPPGDSRLAAHPRGHRRRNGPAGRVRRLWRGRLHQGDHGLDHRSQGRAGGGLCCSAARRARLRSPAWLSRTRGLRQPARRPRRAGPGARPGLPGNRRQRQPGAGGRARSERQRSPRHARERRHRGDQRRRPQSSSPAISPTSHPRRNGSGAAPSSG